MTYKILVPVHSIDEHIIELVHVTENLCKHEHSKVLLLHVLPDLEDIDQTETDSMLDSAFALLDRFAERLCCSVDDVEFRIQMGSPAHEILKCIIIERIDIVAMPTNGHTGIDRLLLGSVAEHVMRHAQCPVVTTRKCDANSAAPKKSIDHILVPLDDTRESARILPLAMETASLHGARLTLFYDEFGISEDEFADVSGQHARERLASVKREIEAAGISVDVQATRFKTPAEEIVRIVEELDVDMVAMTTHGRTGLSRLVFGSVAEETLRTSRCPLLTLSVSPRDEYLDEENLAG